MFINLRITTSTLNLLIEEQQNYIKDEIHKYSNLFGSLPIIYDEIKE